MDAVVVSARTCAWFPLECVTNVVVAASTAPFASKCFLTAFSAPRYLNAPIFWRFSHYIHARIQS